MDAYKKKIGIVVSHTHWDRAWYLTFQQYRLRLVRLVDRLIELLDTNPGFTSFTLDGQTVLLDDYLELRPDRREDLDRLIRGDRLHVGPWYTSPDLFLVSGESVIRNLQYGKALAEQFGSTMRVGYVPDPFGHFAQMPQILKKTGLDSFIFMRGMSEDDKKKAGSLFRWASPDGSEVMAVYLVGGYYNAGNLGYPETYGRFEGMMPDNTLAVKQIDKSIDLLEKNQKENIFLLNNGFDHMPEQPHLPDLIDEINSGNNGLVLKHGTFQDFIDAINTLNTSHEQVTGDLTGNADHPILSSVYSTRIYLKQQNHTAQSLIERYTEPITTWAGLSSEQGETKSFINHAWKLLLLNHPHDDICGCSVDAVHEENESRYRQIEELGNALIVETLENFEKSGFVSPAGLPDLPSTDVFAYNPHPRAGRFRIATKIYYASDVTDAKPCRLIAFDADASPVKVNITGFKPHAMRNNYLESTWGRCYEIEFECDLPATGYSIFRICEQVNDAAEVGDAGPAQLSGIPDVPQQNHSTDDPDKSGNATVTATATATATATEPDELSDLTDFSQSGIEKTEAFFGDIHLTMSRQGCILYFPSHKSETAHFIRFEYQQDAGDTYSFSPIKNGESIWARLISSSNHPVYPDAIRLKYQLTVPAGLDTAEKVTIPIVCDLRPNPQNGIEISVDYLNTAENGRLRIVLPAGTSTGKAVADAHFRLAERSIMIKTTPESSPGKYASYPGELNYLTHHQNDFILFENKADVTWIANRGLHEFELIDEGDAIFAAITLHRAVGYLSVGNGRIRRPHAGPSVPTPGAQCKRRMNGRLCYGITPADTATATATTATAINMARAFSHPAWCREMPWLPHLKVNGKLPLRHSMLEIDNPVIELSAFKQAAGSGRDTVIRIYNPGDKHQPVSLKLGWDAVEYCEADLTEVWTNKSVSPVNTNTLSETLKPFEIKTLIIR